ncbi:membrane protein [Clostridioides difficile]|uniref:CD0519/CD1768 family membrane protein n=1 Tax=Clostridioides sp. GD02404 TaxID=3054354 RepID=UPI0006BBA512|nr:membrane protein [Clostridioides difficile]
MEKLSDKRRVKAVSMETFVFIVLLAVGFGYVGSIMGAGMMFKVIMSTAHALLLDTVFLIMAMAVLAGALSALLSEFGVISLVNKIFKGLMRPIWGLPGASIAGVVATYLSDNPAIIPFAKDKTFTQYFKKYQIPALCNLGTAFGMGLIVTTFMIAQGKEYVLPAIIGNVGAIIGSIISVRIMLTFTKKYYNYDPKSDTEKQVNEKGTKIEEFREIRDGNVFQRTLDAILEGGKLGVEMGMAIIPGVLVVCTLVMLLTFGPSTDPATGQAVYTGAAYEGIKLLPAIGDKISFIIEPLFGFTSPEAIAFPVTALGAVGAAISLVPEFIKSGAITPNDIAVFTAMGMCWSGYLSTHIGMMDALEARPLAGKAILSHTIGGLCAGICAHFIFMLVG